LMFVAEPVASKSSDAVVCVCVCVCVTELEVRLMADHCAVSGVSDIRTLRTLRSTCVIEAFNLHAAVHYQHNDSMTSYTNHSLTHSLILASYQ